MSTDAEFQRFKKRIEERSSQRRAHRAELARQHAEWRRKFDADRRKFDATIASITETQRQMRRDEERFSREMAERSFKGSRSLKDAQRLHVIRCEQAGAVVPADAPFVALWKDDVETHARRLQVTIDWILSTGGINAYALMGQKRIETSPICSARSYSKAMHELGHHARPCSKGHQRVDTGDKPRRSVCLECELEAWRWAIDHAKPSWTRSMHDELVTALPSYRKYATATQQLEIDRLASSLGFREIQLRRLK